MRFRQLHGFVKGGHIGHQCRACHDAARVGFDDRAIDAGCQTEIIRIDDQQPHRRLRLKAKKSKPMPIQKNILILRMIASATPAGRPKPKTSVTNPVPASSTPTKAGTKIKAMFKARLIASSMKAVTSVKSWPISRIVT